MGMEELQIIVNPQAGRGHAGKIVGNLAQELRALGVPHALYLTERPGHAIELAQSLVAAGHHRLASVGGDGTAHEVINGLMAAQRPGEPVELSCIPAGSGNDFALMNGLSPELGKACRTIAAGHSRLIDLGHVTIDGQIARYFDNTVGIGFDGLVCQETRRNKRARGLALYIPAVLKTILVTLQFAPSTLTVDGTTTQIAPMMVTICNGPREGGGFMLAPAARFDDGQLDLVITDRLNRLQMLALVPRFLKGTHLSHPAVSARSIQSLTISSAAPLYAHVDGEILAEEAHHIAIHVVPQSLRLVTPA